MAATWDPLQKGTLVTLSGGNLIADVSGFTVGVRSTLGRDPAAGGVRQWEITVPAGNVGLNTNLRPIFGMILATANIALNNAPLGAGTYSYSSGVRTFANNSTWVNGVNTGANWALAGGGTGGDAHVFGLVYDAANKTFAIYMDGVLQHTLTSVGVNGTLIYPIFGSASSASPGVAVDRGTVNFGASAFTYPVVGATPWGVSVPVADFTATPTLAVDADSMTVAHTDASTNTPASWLWNFGDGSTSTLQNPSHTYGPGRYTVSLTVTNAAGSDTKTRTGYIIVSKNDRSVLAAHRYLAGVRSLAVVNSVAVVASALKKLVNLAVDTVGGAITVSVGLDLAYQPGDVAVVGSNVFSVGDDGYLHKYSTVPVEVSSVAVKATRPWITGARGSFILIHAGGGQIATYNSSLVKLSQRPTSLPDVVYATADSDGNVYAFDGRGNCALLTVSAAGAITFSQKFAVPNSIGVRSAWVDEDDGKLIVGCAQLARVIVVDTTTLAVDSSTMNVGRQLNGLCIGDPDYSAIFEDSNDTMSPDITLPFNCGVFMNTDSFVLGSSKASTALLYVRTGDVS
jgi:PKD repeat protein